LFVCLCTNHDHENAIIDYINIFIYRRFFKNFTIFFVREQTANFVEKKEKVNFL